MAFSLFRTNFEWGQCVVAVDELVYWNSTIGDIAGGWAPREELTNDELQEGVLVELESSPEILTALKSDPRCVWVEDESGWETNAGDT